MTKREVKRILRVWRERLPLDHWDIEIWWDDPPEKEEAHAQVWMQDDYYEAELRFATGWRNWSRRRMNETLVHELAHLLLRDLDTVAIGAAKLLDDQAEKLSRFAWTHAEEALVESLAVRLVRGWGLV